MKTVTVVQKKKTHWKNLSIIEANFPSPSLMYYIHKSGESNCSISFIKSPSSEAVVSSRGKISSLSFSTAKTDGGDSLHKGGQGFCEKHLCNFLADRRRWCRNPGQVFEDIHQTQRQPVSHRITILDQSSWLRVYGGGHSRFRKFRRCHRRFESQQQLLQHNIPKLQGEQKWVSIQFIILYIYLQMTMRILYKILW